MSQRDLSEDINFALSTQKVDRYTVDVLPPNPAEKMAEMMRQQARQKEGIKPLRGRPTWRRAIPLDPSPSLAPRYAVQNPDAPDFAPDLWNRRPVRTDNNCYAYAANHAIEREKPSPQPGMTSLFYDDWHRMTPRHSLAAYVAAIEHGAQIDGFIPTGKCHLQRKGFYTVALFAGEGYAGPVMGNIKDYHWVRENQDGTWSHKLSKSYTHLLVDGAGTPIYDVKAARIRDIGDAEKTFIYHFVSYFLVPQGGLKVGREGISANRPLSFVPPKRTPPTP